MPSDLIPKLSMVTIYKTKCGRKAKYRHVYSQDKDSCEWKTKYNVLALSGSPTPEQELNEEVSPSPTFPSLFGEGLMETI